MPDDADSSGIVSLTDLKQLAELFDAAENCLEPDSSEAKQSQIDFDNAVQRIYDERVLSSSDFNSVEWPMFKSKLRTLCRQYLRKN